MGGLHSMRQRVGVMGMLKDRGVSKGRGGPKGEMIQQPYPKP